MTIERGDTYRLEVCNPGFVPVAPFSLLIDTVLFNTTVAPTLSSICEGCYFFDFIIPCADIPAGTATIVLTDATPAQVYSGCAYIQ